MWRMLYDYPVDRYSVQAKTSGTSPFEAVEIEQSGRDASSQNKSQRTTETTESLTQDSPTVGHPPNFSKRPAAVDHVPLPAGNHEADRITETPRLDSSHESRRDEPFAESSVQMRLSAAREMSKKRKREDDARQPDAEATKQEDNTLSDEQDIPGRVPDEQNHAAQSVATVQPVIKKASYATVAPTLASIDIRLPSFSILVLREMPAPPPASCVYPFIKRVPRTVSPVMLELRGQQMQRDGINNAGTYIKNILDAELAARSDLHHGGNSVKDASSAPETVGEQPREEQPKVAAPATEAQVTVNQRLVTEAEGQTDGSETSAAIPELSFEQFKNLLISDIFREDELPIIYKTYQDNQLPFIEATESNIVRAAELVQNEVLNVNYPAFYGAIASWFGAVVTSCLNGTIAGQQISQPELIDTYMEDAPAPEPAMGQETSEAQLSEPHPDDGMEWEATGFASPSPSPAIFPVIGSAASPVPGSAISATSTHYGSASPTCQKLMMLEQQVLSSNFAMSWPEHFEIFKCMLCLVSNSENDASVELWLDSPDPLHNTGGDFRWWWKTRVGLREMNKLGKVLVRDRDDCEAKQRQRRRSAFADPVATGQAQARTQQSSVVPGPSHSNQQTAQQSNTIRNTPSGTPSGTAASAPPRAQPIRTAAPATSAQQSHTPRRTGPWVEIDILKAQLKTLWDTTTLWRPIRFKIIEIIIVLGRIHHSGPNGRAQIERWMSSHNMNSALAQPRREFYMVYYTRYTLHSDEYGLGQFFAEQSVYFLRQLVNKQEGELCKFYDQGGDWVPLERTILAILGHLSTMDKVPVVKDAVETWLNSKDPFDPDNARALYWRGLWEAQKKDSGLPLLLDQKKIDYQKDISQQGNSRF
ncbi:uncharacterized protein CLAFUR5_07350 [Fulvia fulva]|uniref:Uncharacterized protein n=1 Tax=Passalora fulva TaxID=5499 RepID=A0A9Q8PAD8_PASFU|nr:uncharacterized protein CLAFUR5_07350 [Fulvia fulva]UJO18832.1 hypothetical protein CLAFUR5_07350 [Fulvia fulva]WPV30755.1 hypothetical protein CLAFUW7_07218 [Fulvia fulva]